MEDTRTGSSKKTDSTALIQVRTQCPHCKAKFKTKGQSINKKAKCSKCGEVFVIHPEDTCHFVLSPPRRSRKPEDQNVAPSASLGGPGSSVVQVDDGKKKGPVKKERGVLFGVMIAVVLLEVYSVFAMSNTSISEDRYGQIAKRVELNGVKQLAEFYNAEVRGEISLGEYELRCNELRQSALDNSLLFQAAEELGHTKEDLEQYLNRKK
jgi:predicted Zn finger-like uncharacterized protein